MSRARSSRRKSNSPEPGEKPTPPCPQCGGVEWVITDAMVEPRRFPKGFITRWYWHFWRKAI